MTYDTINDAVTMAGGGETLLAGRYRVVRQLGQGGMGSVWLAEDTQLDNKQFAIKMLPSILVSNKRAYRQLKDEALVAMKLTHTNIVTLRAFEENNGNPFLVMDYVDGRTLDDYLAERGTLTEQETVSLLLPVAAALDYAHSKNIIHRDIKPGNVMIAGDGAPYILDFGIAREMQEATTRVTGKLSSGTLMYMSPEQLHGAVPKAAQDVYSFATMVYECLSGAPPFTRGQIEYQVEHDAPAPLPEGFSIAKAVMSGLAKKPEDRPKTCSAILGLSGVEMASRAITPQPFAESVAPSRAPSGRQDVAERLLQSAQAVLEVDRMLAEVVKFENASRDPKIHSSRMAIKSARGEMESASGARCMELLEATKVIFAEAKSAYEDHVAKRRFIDEISEFTSGTRGRRELRYEPGVLDCLREVEQLKAEAENAADGSWRELQEKFLRAREKTEAEIRAALEKSREAAEKKRLEEAARRQAEELRKRQELEEQKRKEQAEIESCKAKTEAARQEIRDEYDKVVAYVKANPDYVDCLPVAKEIYASTHEEEPAGLKGLCERLKRYETDLGRIRSLILGHDVVVCATLNGVEVGRASMLYGRRRIDLPVRIKRRHRLTANEGYLIEYARGSRKYYGWFSPACVKSSEGQCAMVPLRGELSISEISRAYRKKKPASFLWDVLVSLVVSAEFAGLVCVLARECTWAAVAGGIVAAVLCFRARYCGLMRREMRCALCDNGQYRMLPQSTFGESVLLLDRRERTASKMLKEYKLLNWEKLLWRLLVALYFSLNIGLFVCLSACCMVSGDSPAGGVCGLLAFLAAFFFSCKTAFRRENQGVLIGLDAYRAKRAESSDVEVSEGTSVEEKGVHSRKFPRRLVLWAAAFCILVVGGLCCWRHWENVQAEKAHRERQAEMQAEQKANAERARRDAEHRRMEEEMSRRRDEERRKAEEAAEKRRRESEELDGFRRKIADKVGFAERKVREAEKYRGDPVGFESHLATLDAAAAKMKAVPAPKTPAEAKGVLESVNAAAETISAELDLLAENMPRREAARRIEREMKSGLDAELVQFEAEATVAGSYFRGQALRRYGNAALEKGDFSLAQANLAEAKVQLTKALAEAKAMRKKRLAEVEAARIAAEKAEAARKEQEETARMEAERSREREAERLRELREEAARLRDSSGNIGNGSARDANRSSGKRQVSVSGRSSVRFTPEDADTLSLLKFSSPVARSYYEKACKLAREGAHNKAKVKSEYSTGRACGGPEWPELEAWLNWWK